MCLKQKRFIYSYYLLSTLVLKSGFLENIKSCTTHHARPIVDDNQIPHWL